MRLPISSTLVVQGATHRAGEVARRVGQAVGFADVLAGGASPPLEEIDLHGSTSTSQGDLRAELVESIDRILRESGINLDQSLQVSIDTDGALRVVSDHERAAEIEAKLESDSGIRRLAQQWASSTSTTAGERFRAASRSLDLTIPASTGTILPVPGGYPNW
ncbi:MAG: hypothetical protein VYA84_03690 [Planctomycetota bacterium]|nr:hypothetical protein [Planctomycetota bacterium]